MLSTLNVRTILVLVLSAFIGLFISSGAAGILMLKHNQATISDLGRQGIEQANHLADASLYLFMGRVALINAKTYMEGGMTEQRDAALEQAVTLLDRSQASFEQFQRSLMAEDVTNTSAAIQGHATDRIDDITSAQTNVFANADQANQGAASPDLLQNYNMLINQALLPLVKALQGWNGIEANRIVDQVIEPATNAFLKSLETFQHSNRQLAQQGIEDAKVVSSRAIQTLAVVLGLAFLMVFVVHRVLRRVLLKPLDNLQAHFNTMATGDLRTKLPPGGNTEIGRLQDGVRHMQESLIRTTAAMQAEASVMRVDTNHIAQRNQQISRQIDLQATALDHAARTIETLDETVAQNTAYAAEATELAQDAQNTTRSGHEAVTGVIASMDEISSCAKRIGAIVQLINGIATQTNLLALNAAVEAARAGAHGKGFAVVANEVRDLAHRSSQAANDIKALITASDQSVAVGMQQVQQAGKAMDAVLASVEAVNQRMHWIAQAAAQQNEGIADVKSAVSSVRQDTQANLELIRQTSDAATALNEQAMRLHGIASAFLFSEDTVSSAHRHQELTDGSLSTNNAQVPQLASAS